MTLVSWNRVRFLRLSNQLCPRECSEEQKGACVADLPRPPPLWAQPSREGAAASVCSRCRPNDALMPYVKSHHLLSRLTFRATAPSNKRRRRGPSSTLAFESTAVGKRGGKKKKYAFHFAFVDRSTRIPPSLPRLRGTARVSPRACARRRSSAALIRICRLASSADSFWLSRQRRSRLSRLSRLYFFFFFLAGVKWERRSPRRGRSN